ncbi:MAG: alanine racemase [Lachnospiraceae bacterium]|nr:alanine racemase [Lachnospiraceae bacterium]
MKQYKRVCAYVDLDAIKSNLESIKQNIAEDTKILAVIKCDGYGHGAVQIARELEQIPYVYGYATATEEESHILRQCGMKKPIVILGYTFPESYERIVRENIRPTVFRRDQAEQISEAAVSAGRKVKVHIKVDTGMSRIGIAPDADGVSFVKYVMDLPGLEVEGIFTHFATADEEEKEPTLKQLQSFCDFCDAVETQCGIKIPLRHCSNSAGVIEYPQANMNLVRAGIILYGLWPSDAVAKDKVGLTPVMTLKSHIVYVKEIEKGTPVSYGGTYVAPDKRKIATIPVGYGDGYPRGLSGKGFVLVHGKKAPIVGRVCMDQFMVDVTDIDSVQEGDEVTLIGMDKEQQLSMEYLGDLSGRFNYELACGLAKRIPRVFVKGGEVEGTRDYFEDYR